MDRHTGEKNIQVTESNQNTHLPSPVCSLGQRSTTTEHSRMRADQAREWEESLELIEEVLLVLQLDLVQLLEQVTSSLDRGLHRMQARAREAEEQRLAQMEGRKEEWIRGMEAEGHGQFENNVEALWMVVGVARRETAEMEERRMELIILDKAFWRFAEGVQNRLANLWYIVKKGTSSQHSIQVVDSCQVAPLFPPVDDLEQSIHAEMTPVEEQGKEAEWAREREESLGAMEQGRLLLQLGLVQVLEGIMGSLDRGLLLRGVTGDVEERTLVQAEGHVEEGRGQRRRHGQSHMEEEEEGFRRKGSRGGAGAEFAETMPRNIMATQQEVADMKAWRSELDGLGEAYCRYSVEMEQRMAELTEPTSTHLSGPAHITQGPARLTVQAVVGTFSKHGDSTAPTPLFTTDPYETASLLCVPFLHPHLLGPQPPNSATQVPFPASALFQQEPARLAIAAMVAGDRLKAGTQALCPGPVTPPQLLEITWDLRQQTEIGEQNERTLEKKDRKKGGRRKGLKRLTQWFRTLLRVKCLQ
ncbi:hypothetical protein SKAU_G00098990 [Synaphobranchus kaupii]|uniref:Uncharacterized protein n=1 Tax=Synaphobranchus kaupii TaxID=118154 RepID=A0A9Q1J777_SYNKA|nr:hypothetical protein SKAU_G00098990 [Synaphobranchus kaupii]